MKVNYVGAVGLSLSLLLLGAGCGQSIAQKATEKAIERAIEKDSGGNVDLNLGDNKVAFTDKEGNQVQYGENITLPTDFPKEIPVYANGSITSTATSKDGTILTMQTKDKSTDIVAWYEAQLAGWTKDASFDSQGFTTRAFSKDDMELSVLISGGEDQTVISVQLTKKQK